MVSDQRSLRGVAPLLLESLRMFWINGGFLYDQPIVLNRHQACAAKGGALHQQQVDRLERVAVDTHNFTHFAMKTVNASQAVPSDEVLSYSAHSGMNTSICAVLSARYPQKPGRFARHFRTYASNPTIRAKKAAITNEINVLD